jgi:peroxiredoxin
MSTVSKKWKTTRVMALAALVLAVLSATACDAGSGSQQSNAPDGDSGAGPASANSDKDAGPSIKTLGGEEFSLAEKRGEVVALYFMAGWCGTCVPEARVWSDLYPAYKDEGLEVLIVSADPNDSPDTIEYFKDAGGIGDLPWAIDETGEFTRSFDVRALDSTVIIDREGKIAYRDAVPTERGTLEKELEEVL